MLDLISMSGPFGLLATAAGLLAAGLNIFVLIRPSSPRAARAALALAAAAFLIGIAGTGTGLMVASEAVMAAEPAIQELLWARGQAVAETTTALGAIWASISAVLMAIGQWRGVKFSIGA